MTNVLNICITIGFYRKNQINENVVYENYVFLIGQGNIRTLTTCHSCLWCIKHIYMLVKSALARVFCQTNDHYVSHKFRAHVYLTPIIEVEKGSKKKLSHRCSRNILLQVFMYMGGDFLSKDQFALNNTHNHMIDNESNKTGNSILKSPLVT